MTMSQHENAQGASTTERLQRPQRRRQAPPQMVPVPLDEPDMVAVDTTWGELQPMSPAPGVETIGELELMNLVADGALLVDGRTEQFFADSTLPGAISVPFNRAIERRGDLGDDALVILFCNGPQCPQSPTAIRNLVDDGFPADRIRYYRGGMHDWTTMALPVVPGTPA